MVLEVGRLMTETSLYFIEANIFRGLSQLSRKTQLCVLLGRGRVWFSGSCVFCENVFKKQGIQFHKHLEQGVFFVQKPLKADVRVDLPTSRAQFFYERAAIKRSDRIPSWLCLVKTLLLRIRFLY